MPARGRDRHSRGLRGPLALAGPMNPRAASPPARAGKSEFFADAVQAAVDRISRQCPDALAGVAVGIEDVPFLESAWTGPRVPLAAAVEAVPDQLRARCGVPAPAGAPSRQPPRAAHPGVPDDCRATVRPDWAQRGGDRPGGPKRRGLSRDTD